MRRSTLERRLEPRYREGVSGERAYPRLPMTVPIGVGTDTHPDCAGMTRNISAGGVLFHSASRFRPGEEVALVFRLGPGHPETHVTGRIVRVERDGTALPFVMAVQFYRPVDALAHAAP